MGSSTASLVQIVMVVMLVFTAAGCAKRPDITVAAASAPAPTAPAPAAPPAPAPTPAPPAVQPAAPAPAAVAPAPPPVERPVTREFAPNDALRPIQFDFDKSDIRPGDAQTLERNAEWLNQHRDHLVLVEGHCDPRGTNEYNLALGERRAQATKNFLVSRGVADRRVSIVSYGEERPVCHEATEQCWARDRRAVLLTKPE
jgi:peptidoglycan-associated lipoprotein